MRIDRIETFVLQAPLPSAARFYSSQGFFARRSSLLVCVTTDAGLCGWGESGVSMPVAHLATYIHEVLAERLLGRDPLETEPIWHELYSFSRDFGRKGACIDAMSGLDTALWDIRGREAGKPIHALLGGAYRDRVTAYATGFYYAEGDLQDPAAAVDRVRLEAEGHREAGFRAMKAKIGLLPFADDLARLEALRETAGDNTLLMADANHAYHRATARRVGGVLDDLGFHWFEEPVVPEDVAGCAALRRALRVAIASGECEYTRWGMLDLLRSGAVDILQPDVSACGGISETQKIVALATAHHTPVCLHVWGSAVAFAAALQVTASIPPIPHTAAPRPGDNEPLFEFDRTANPLRDLLIDGGFRLRDGSLDIPDGPGLGIDVRRETLDRFTVSRRVSSG
ncbi:MAG: mandelate racemase/muconate lactonizing enzyme family protein [Lentisphaeria bacterium]|nr:mandelate racemase/muconate lactonizing enzyme family protein [Lentisphaeria bacterium]